MNNDLNLKSVENGQQNDFEIFISEVSEYKAECVAELEKEVNPKTEEIEDKLASLLRPINEEVDFTTIAFSEVVADEACKFLVKIVLFFQKIKQFPKNSTFNITLL